MQTMREGSHRKIANRLARHAELTEQLVAEGMPRAEASREALRRMEGRRK